MTYELTIEQGKEKAFISILKQLDFVTVKPVKKTAQAKNTKLSAFKGDLPYFGACPDWDMDIKAERGKSAKKRISKW